jgi:hypothetical protein
MHAVAPQPGYPVAGSLSGIAAGHFPLGTRAHPGRRYGTTALVPGPAGPRADTIRVLVAATFPAVNGFLLGLSALFLADHIVGYRYACRYLSR